MMNTNKSDKKTDVEVADIMQTHIGDYQKKYKLHPAHYKVVRDILNCRTSYLGGHVEECDECGTKRNAYNSCRNRHCPKCQSMAKEKWLQKRKAELLPVNYFHNVFTLPHEINPVALYNKKVVYNILFKSAAETLLQFGKNPEGKLKGKIGIHAVLHTWSQLLLDHFHLHCIVPGGALSFDQTRWIECKYDYLFNVKALSIVFRAKFIDYFKIAYTNGELQFFGKSKSLGTKNGFKNLIDQLWKKSWVVYSKKPFSGPEKVLEYLARYTHRVAISNYRIKSLHNSKVTFTYRDRDLNVTKEMAIEAVEFIRRYLLHVLPDKFMRIRHFGLFANRYKSKNISRCRRLMGLSSELPGKIEKSIREIMLEVTGIDICKCPYCKKGTMRKVIQISKATGISGFEIISGKNIRASP